MAVEILKSLKVGIGTNQPNNDRVISTASVGALQNSSKVYSLEGKLLAIGVGNKNMSSLKKMRTVGIYVVAQKSIGAHAQLLLAQ
jgi:hydrogenase maturation factor